MTLIIRKPPGWRGWFWVWRRFAVVIVVNVAVLGWRLILGSSLYDLLLVGFWAFMAVALWCLHQDQKLHLFDPDWCLRPGLTIDDIREERGESIWDVAFAMATSTDEVEALIAGDDEIDDEFAERLEIWSGVPAQFWLNLEANYRDGLARGLTDVSDT